MEPRPSSSSDPARSLNRQIILDEDEYTEALSQIIARDFFPSLVHLDATNEYLNALNSNDPNLIHASVRKLEELSTPHSRRPWQTPSQTPYGAGPSETPLRTPRGEPVSKKPKLDTNISLDDFQARYTSEDNSSFTQIVDDENRKRREVYGWAWDAQKRVDRQRGKMLEQRERLLLEAGPGGPGVKEKFRLEAPKPIGLITSVGEDGQGKGKEVNLVTRKNEGEQGDMMLTREKGYAGTLVERDGSREDDNVLVPRKAKDTRSAGVDGWEFRTRNALMFPPDADESPYQYKPPASSEVVKPPPPKIIKYGNTRLPEQDDTPSQGISMPPSPTRSRIDAAIAGTPYRPKSPTGDNFSLVPSIPSPTPSELGPTAVKQLMTWGTLNATPRILNRSDDPAEAIEIPPPDTFQIAPPTAREQLSHKLSSSAAKSLRAKAGLLGLSSLGTPSSIRGQTSTGVRRGSMPPPTLTPRKVEGGLTPAAKRLLDRTTLGTAAARRAEAMGRMAGWGDANTRAKETDLSRIRWTPTPNTKRG